MKMHGILVWTFFLVVGPLTNLESLYYIFCDSIHILVELMSHKWEVIAVKQKEAPLFEDYSWLNVQIHGNKVADCLKGVHGHWKGCW